MLRTIVHFEATYVLKQCCLKTEDLLKFLMFQNSGGKSYVALERFSM
jgi:hypothetical protein